MPDVADGALGTQVARDLPRRRMLTNPNKCKTIPQPSWVHVGGNAVLYIRTNAWAEFFPQHTSAQGVASSDAFKNS